MSHGWQLGGSVVLSKIRGNRSDTRGSNWGWSGFADANYWVNRYGPTGHDQPVIVKLYGTAELPWGFMASFFYAHFDGYPWQRSVTVVPPAAWAAANNARTDAYGVNIEPMGTRRNPATDNLDMRFEKVLDVGFGRLGVFVDIFNLLGHKYLYPNNNPGGTWRPADVNTNLGTFTPAGTYRTVTGLAGVRTFKFSARFTF
jgi:hypothetical protein